MFGLKQLFFRIFLIIPLFFFVSPAYGYIPQGRHLIQLMLEGLNLPGTLYVKQRLVISDPRVGPEIHSIDQNVRIRLPEEYRSDIDTGQLRQFQVTAPSGSITVIGNHIVSETQTWMEFYKDLLVYRSRDRLADRMAQSGVDLSATGLGRFNGKICYIIGAARELTQSPQLWLSKDTFFPVRWLFTTGSDQALSAEIRYYNWRHADGFWYPFEIEFYRNGEMVRKIEVISVEKNIVFSDNIFDLSMLKQRYAPDKPAQSETPVKTDIQREIENFKHMFE